MATHANSTPAPARTLLPLAFRPVPPVDDARSAVEILDEIRRAIEAQEAETHPELPPEPLLPAADLGRAIHLRRLLADAVDHGTDLLAALGLPRLVEPDHIVIDPAAAGDALDLAIAALDALDGDPDLEPYLAGWYNGRLDPDGEREGDEDPAEDDGTAEPSLASPERHPTVPWSGNYARHYVTRDPQDTQARWADGGQQDTEGDIVDELHDGDGEDLEAEPSEPSLGSIEAVSQLGWAAGGTSEAEFDATDCLDWRKTVAESEAAYARRPTLRELAAKAHEIRSRTRHVPLSRFDPDTVTPIGPGMMAWGGPTRHALCNVVPIQLSNLREIVT